MDKNIKKIVELKIDEADITFNELGLEVVSLVEEPAIEVNWKAFSKEGETDEVEEVELQEIKHGESVFTIEQQKSVLQLAAEIGKTIDVEDIYFELKEESFSTIGKILKGLSVINALTTYQAASDEGELYYRYSGRPAQRNFCRALQRMNKVYSKEDIDEMEVRGINQQLGHEGQPYSIWNYKGGVNCFHYWSAVRIFQGTNNQKVIIDLGPVSGLPGEIMNYRQDKGHHPDYQFTKQQFSINEEKRIVMGPLLIPNKMILRQDENGEPYYVFFSRETIKKIAEKFFKDNRQNNTDINHDEVITKENTLLESWIVEDTTHDKSFVYGYRVPKGTWMASYKINDEQTWSLIKEGKLNGFSIAGFFAEKSKEKESQITLQKIIELLNEVETN
jgi:predicted transcriptional regulator